MAFASFFVASLLLGAYGIMLWPVALMVVLSGGLLARAKVLQTLQAPAIFAYGGLFTVAWLRSFELPGWSRTPGKIHLISMNIALAVGALALLVLLWKSDRATRKAAIFWVWICGLCSLVAMFSGSGGGPDPMFEWLAKQGITGANADLAVFAFRKSVHFTFYGILALSAFKMARSAGIGPARFFAIALALSHAGFDEIRQSTARNRTGSPVDVLIDACGMACFLALAGAFRRENRD